MIELTFTFNINDRAFTFSKERGIREVVIIEAQATVSQRGTVQMYRVADVCDRHTSLVDISNVVATYDEASVIYENLIGCN